MMSIIKSYWQVFRIIFVLFSLYLAGDALWRWDGFGMYDSFPAFLPALCLVSILWTLIGAITAYVIWLPARIIWHSVAVSFQIKLILLLGIFYCGDSSDHGNRMVCPLCDLAKERKTDSPFLYFSGYHNFCMDW